MKATVENKNKLYKIDKITKKTKTIQTKPYHSNSFKQRGNFTNCINKYNASLTNTKKDENNSSNILNNQKNLYPNKYSNSKQNKLPISKKLNIIKETNENTNNISKSLNNNINKKNFQRNNNNTNKQLIIDKNKSYTNDNFKCKIINKKKKMMMGKKNN